MEDIELMNVALSGTNFSREFEIRKISHIGRYFGMIASNKRLRRSLRETSREVVKRT
jgi:hypothetical protein